MGAVLESVSKSPILSSAFKSLLLTLSIFWLRGSGFGFLAALLFFFVFSLFYFRPRIGSSRFLASAAALVLLVVSLPYITSYEIYFSATSGFLFYLLLGVKNLGFMRRKDFYYLLHFAEIIALSALFLKGIIHPLLAFVVFFFIFREFYVFFFGASVRRVSLIGAGETLILGESLWIISFLPLGILAGVALAAALIFVFHDLTLRHLEGSLSRDLVLRNATVMIFLTLFILGTSRWTLS